MSFLKKIFRKRVESFFEQEKPNSTNTMNFNNSNQRIGNHDAKLMFLHCIPIFKIGLQPTPIKESKFQVSLPPEWKLVAKEDVSKNNRKYRFMGQGHSQWFSIEYFFADNVSSSDLSNWVEAPLTIFGYPLLHLPNRIKIDFENFQKIDSVDFEYMKTHNLDEMCSYIAVGQVNGVTYKIFIVTLRRGNNAWKLEVVFPMPDEDKKDLTHQDMINAAAFIGNFEII